MQDDVLDKMLKDAAAQYHPAYNDKAWEDMNARLEKHMPQQKEKRRTWLWLLLPVLATFIAAGIVWFTQPANNDAPATKNTATDNNSKQASPAAEKGIQPNTNASATVAEPAPVTAGIAPQSSAKQPGSNVAGNSFAVIPVFTKPGNSNLTGTGSRYSRKAKTRATITPAAAYSPDNTVAGKYSPGSDKTTVTPADATNSDDDTVAPEKTVTENISVQPAAVAKKEAEVKQNKTVAETEKKPADKNATETKVVKSISRSGKFANNLAFTISAGPDYSFVKTNQPGETRLAYGAGIAYTFAKYFTVKAGVYAARKVYTTDTNSYKNKAPIATYYNIEKIKGNCLVYEVPVSIQYNFAQKGRHNWFAGAGISSVFMKKETYSYYYERGGALMYRDYDISNKNNHLFSTLTLSAGWQYRLNKNISLAAEPYYKMAISGVGEGSLKLKSTGVLFSAVISPFRKRK